MKINNGKLCLCCVLAAVTILPGCASSGQKDTKTATQTTEQSQKVQLDKYELEGIDLESGKTIGNKMLDKDINLLFIWQESCPPCKVEAEAIESMYKEYEDVSFIGLGIGESKEKVAEAVKKFGLTNVNYQLSPKFIKKYENKITSTPTVLILDKDGKEILPKKVGSGEGANKEKVREELKAMIEGAKNAK